MTDQRGVVYTYTYDNSNRVTLDHITSLGDAAKGVDDAGRDVRSDREQRVGPEKLSSRVGNPFYTA